MPVGLHHLLKIFLCLVSFINVRYGKLCEPLDRIHWCTDIMGYVKEERGFDFICVFFFLQLHFHAELIRDLPLCFVDLVRDIAKTHNGIMPIGAYPDDGHLDIEHPVRIIHAPVVDHIGSRFLRTLPDAFMIHLL